MINSNNDQHNRNDTNNNNYNNVSLLKRSSLTLPRSRTFLLLCIPFLPSLRPRCKIFSPLSCNLHNTSPSFLAKQWLQLGALYRTIWSYPASPPRRAVPILSLGTFGIEGRRLAHQYSKAERLCVGLHVRRWLSHGLFFLPQSCLP
jgi:hypothetical protein